MKQPDILRLLSKPYPEIQKDIEIGQRLIKAGKIEHGGEKYRDAARRMLSQKMTSFSIDYYTYASDLFITCGNYLKAINAELTIYNIHKLTNDVLEMANSQEKIASYYKHYLKDYYKAGTYYFSAANIMKRIRIIFQLLKKQDFQVNALKKQAIERKKSHRTV